MVNTEFVNLMVTWYKPKEGYTQGVSSFHIMECTEQECLYLVTTIYYIYGMHIMNTIYLTENVSFNSAIHLRVLSSFYLANIVYRPYWVCFVKQKVSLHLGSADLRMGSQCTLSKPLSFRGRLVRVKPPEHLYELPVSAMTNVLLQVNTAGSDQCCV